VSEICDGAALLFEPEDEHETALRMQRLSEDSGLRSELQTAGTLKAGGFTWERSARQHLDVYRAALEADAA
jgi:glycosyltransferase involved in cell wall biosynthesis